MRIQGQHFKAIIYGLECDQRNTTFISIFLFFCCCFFARLSFNVFLIQAIVLVMHLQFIFDIKVYPNYLFTENHTVFIIS